MAAVRAGAAGPLTAGEVYGYLKSLDGGWVQWDKTVDTFKSGSPAAQVKGIAVAWMSYTHALKKALELGCNMFVTHEPTYFNHRDDDARIFRFPAAKAKREFIEKSGLVILRCHDLWDQYPKIGIPSGWGQLLELGDPIEGSGYYYVYDGKGRTAGAVARQIALVVERREAAEDRSRLQDQLRHADRLATIGQLSAGVAHELNEPLGNILAFAQLAGKEPGVPDQVARDLEKIVTTSLHAREIIKKLMLFARQMPPRKTRVSLNAVIEEGLYFLESRCAKEGVAIERRLATGLPEIVADPSQLNQVLVNLVVNAIQAMREGGTLTIATRRSGSDVVLMVEDTGTGMDHEVLGKIFTPFFTTKDIHEGTGLGLPVVHGIVSSHGGTIGVDSTPGQGTRFEIRLPVADQKEDRESLSNENEIVS